MTTHPLLFVGLAAAGIAAIFMIQKRRKRTMKDKIKSGLDDMQEKVDKMADQADEKIRELRSKTA